MRCFFSILAWFPRIKKLFVVVWCVRTTFLWSLAWLANAFCTFSNGNMMNIMKLERWDTRGGGEVSKMSPDFYLIKVNFVIEPGHYSFKKYEVLVKSLWLHHHYWALSGDAKVSLSNKNSSKSRCGDTCLLLGEEVKQLNLPLFNSVISIRLTLSVISVEGSA